MTNQFTLTAFPPLLIAAAHHHLGRGKKKSFPSLTSLNLAAEVLAVDCGLKPSFLYDHSTAGIKSLQNYLHELQDIGWIQHHMLLLDIADNILMVNLEKTVLNLETALLNNRVVIVDVSAAQTIPTICGPGHLVEIKRHISELLNYLSLFRNGKAGTVSVGTIFFPEWNLCTIFGLLLGYPVSYWFDTGKGFEDCLTLTPLRVFSAELSCHKINDSMRFQVYSFSVPECLHVSLKDHLDAWSENLKHAFSRQNSFSDLCVGSRAAVLAAVAL